MSQMLSNEERLAHLEHRMGELETLPNRSLLFSNSFLTRCFAVWGLSVVASLIISIPLILFYAFLFFALLSGPFHR